MIAYASGHTVAAKTLLGKIEQVILFPVISFMLGVALLYFLWGAYEFVRNADNETGRETGKQHMLYGIIGFFLMVSVWGLVNILTGTFSFGTTNGPKTIPHTGVPVGGV